MRKSLLACCLLLLGVPAFSQPETRGRKSDAPEYRHSISFTPFSGMVTYKEFNPGAGMTYEYMISREAGIGIQIPVMVGFAGPEQSDFGYQSYKHSVIYTAPGVRFHTGRRRSNVDFVTGPSLLIGNMHFSPQNNNYYNPPGRPFDYSMVGLVADNSLNFYRRHFAFGFDVRLGTMLDRRDDTRFFIHFGMHFGGIF